METYKSDSLDITNWKSEVVNGVVQVVQATIKHTDYQYKSWSYSTDKDTTICELLTFDSDMNFLDGKEIFKRKGYYISVI